MKRIIYCAFLMAIVALNVFALTPGPLNPTDPAITVPPAPTQLQGKFHSYMIDNGNLVIIIENGALYAGKIQIDGSRMVEYIMSRLVITNAGEKVSMYTPALPPNLKFITHSEYVIGKDVNVADLNIVGVKFARIYERYSGSNIPYDENNLNCISFFKEVVTPPQVARTIFNVNISIVANEEPSESHILGSIGIRDYSFVFQETVEFDYMIGQFVQLLLSRENLPAIILPVPYGGTNITGFRFRWTSGDGFPWIAPSPASRSSGLGLKPLP